MRIEHLTLLPLFIVCACEPHRNGPEPQPGHVPVPTDTLTAQANSGCPAAYFELMGDLPENGVASEASDISANGRYVIGHGTAEHCSAAHCFQAFGWTRPCWNKPFLITPATILYPSGGMVGLGYLPADPMESNAFGISPDGRETAGWCYVGTGELNEAVIFSQNGLKRRLGMLTGHITSVAMDVSDTYAGKGRDPQCGLDFAVLRSWKRRVIVGYSSSEKQQPKRTTGARAVQWSPWPCAPQPLTLPATTPNGAAIGSSEAVSVSDDGRIIAGTVYHGTFDNDGTDDNFCPWSYESTGVVWVLNSAGTGYSPLFIDHLASPFANTVVTRVSGDGRTIIGSSRDKAGVRACVWRFNALFTAVSPPQPLGPLDGLQNSVAQGVSFDGKVVVGHSGTFDCITFAYDQRATIWSLQGNAKPRDLVALMQKQGLAKQVVTGWKTAATACSADGRTIIGIAEYPIPTPEGEDYQCTAMEGWIVALP